MTRQRVDRLYSEIQAAESDPYLNRQFRRWMRRPIHLRSETSTALARDWRRSQWIPPLAATSAAANHCDA